VQLTDSWLAITILVQAAVNGPFSQIGQLASLLAKLQRHQPGFVIAVVDALLEDMHDNLLVARPESRQRRLAHARLLAECYNHQVIRSPLLFYALYLTISLGAR
jgi:MIF4G domain